MSAHYESAIERRDIAAAGAAGERRYGGRRKSQA